jgi:hypothetical protein
MTGYLLLAAFMALVIVGAGMPVGLFAPAKAFGNDCPDCGQPLDREHRCPTTSKEANHV